MFLGESMWQWACYRSWFGIRCGVRSGDNKQKRLSYSCSTCSLLTSITHLDSTVEAVVPVLVICTLYYGQGIFLHITACYLSQGHILFSSYLHGSSRYIYIYNWNITIIVLKGNIQSLWFLWMRRLEDKMKPPVLTSELVRGQTVNLVFLKQC